MRAEPARAWGLLVIALALSVRLGYVAFFATRHLPLADPLSYHLLANAIGAGHGFVNPLQLAFAGRAVRTASEPPLFPLVLAASSAVGAQSVLAHQLIGVALGTGTVLAVKAVGKALAGARAGLLGATIAALYPPLWLNDGGIMAESLFALVVAGLLIASYRFAGRPSVPRAALIGCATGLAILTRVEAALLVPFLLVPLLGGRGTRAKARRERALHLGVALGVALLVISPWVIRNLATFDRLTFVSTGDGTLAGANCAPAYRGPKIGLWVISCYREAAPGDESDANAAWRRQGLTYARDHAGRVPLVVAVRVARIWQVFGPLQDARVNRDDGRPSWMNMLALGAYAALVPGAVAGGVVLRRRGQRLLPLGAQVALVTATAAMVWGAVRFRSPADVAMVVLAGVALDRVLPASMSPPPVTMGRCP